MAQDNDVLRLRLSGLGQRTFFLSHMPKTAVNFVLADSKFQCTRRYTTEILVSLWGGETSVLSILFGISGISELSRLGEH